ncbi:MAG: twin-arginine translocase TatA/TatE family subunit [Flavobacteriaceae bacterium]|nr:twin-arginine translocase TatA/TatE family subunit [Flavobacteriaceae bacterium]
MNALFLPLVIGAPQIVLIVVVILLLFGGRKIPELMRGLGSGIKEFKDASKEDEKKDEFPKGNDTNFQEKK